jgi:hypothetical protein
MTREHFLTVFLRLVGTVAGTAAFCAVMPLGWMDAVHRALGMGALPQQPIVEYLARSTSALYALMGALFWILSLDTARYRPLLRLLGPAIIVLGLLLLWIDINAGMPRFWQLAEGPANILLGTIILVAARQK